MSINIDVNIIEPFVLFMKYLRCDDGKLIH